MVSRWEAFLAANDIGIAGIEFIVDEAGQAFTYDVNTNTNYNAEAEVKDGRRGMMAIADYLSERLVEEQVAATPAVAAAVLGV